MGARLMAALPASRRRWRLPGDGPGRRDVGLRMAVGRFMLASLFAVVLLAVVGLAIQRDLAEEDAVGDARTLTEVTGRAVVAPYVNDAVIAGDPAALERLDRVVRQRVLGTPVVRVKIWAPDGRIAYSDEPRLIGDVYPLGAEGAEALRSGESAAELSDLSGSENRFERGYGELLEVYLPLETPAGTVLYEGYQLFESVTVDGRHLWMAFMPVLVGAVLLLWLTQAPLAWSLARRLRAGQEERRHLLRRTVDAESRERRRIAGDLHDGVVQDLAGAALSLAAARGSLGRAPAGEIAALLDEGVATIRESMRRLRDMLIEISPPGLDQRGIRPALEDLLTAVRAGGVVARLDAEPGTEATGAQAWLIHRAAQEALRNVERHAGASSVVVRLARADGRLVLTVEDDGVGFTTEDRAAARGRGHVGLDLLGAIAADAGGVLEVSSAPGAGTTVRLEVPA